MQTKKVTIASKNTCLILFLALAFAPFYGGAKAKASQLADEASQAKLHESEEWRNLLHFAGGKSRVRQGSDFFLSPAGYKDPEAELTATLLALQEDPALGEAHAICRFPARAAFIAEHLNLPEDFWPEPDCPGYREFVSKVSADEVWLSFAAENNSSPSSMMGHLFLKLAGDVNGVRREHSFSFYAAIPDQNFIQLYVTMLAGLLDGVYALAPYKNKQDEYLRRENRPIWEFEIDLSPAARRRLLDHMWELRGKIVYYDFVWHNCGTAGANMLEAAEAGLVPRSSKPFTTPLEYIQRLDAAGKIKRTELVPTPVYTARIKKYGLKDILSAQKSSKIYAYYQNNGTDAMGLSVMPVYTDISDPSNAYYDYLETKFLSFDLAYAPSKDSFYVDKIDLIRLRSIMDSSTGFALSRQVYFGLSNRHGATNTRLRPEVEFGFGYAHSLSAGVTPYVMPIFGYRYDEVHNFYLAPEIGLVIQPHERVRIIPSAEYRFNSERGNKGYKSRAGASLGLKISDNLNAYASYNYYGEPARKSYNEIRAGLGYFF